jgi:hypothetical protein
MAQDHARPEFIRFNEVADRPKNPHRYDYMATPTEERIYRNLQEQREDLFTQSLETRAQAADLESAMTNLLTQIASVHVVMRETAAPSDALYHSRRATQQRCWDLYLQLALELQEAKTHERDLTEQTEALANTLLMYQVRFQAQELLTVPFVPDDALAERKITPFPTPTEP